MKNLPVQNKYYAIQRINEISIIKVFNTIEELYRYKNNKIVDKTGWNVLRLCVLYNQQQQRKQ